MSDPFPQTGVVGPGTMGCGIARLLAGSGRSVRLIGPRDASLQEGLERIRTGLERAVQREQIEEETRQSILERIDPSLDVEDLRDVDLVVEATPEDLEVKQSVFDRLDRLTDSPTVLASTTSSLPIGRLAAATDSPQRVVGLHFFNPPTAVDGVEVISTDATDPEIIQQCTDLLKALGKQPVRIEDTPGFVASRLLMLYLVEAARAVDDSQPPEAVDTIMVEACNMPMGPLALLDMIGLDTALNVLEILEEAYGDRYRPPDFLYEWAETGKLGRKSGEGFFSYDR